MWTVWRDPPSQTYEAYIEINAESLPYRAHFDRCRYRAVVGTAHESPWPVSDRIAFRIEQSSDQIIGTHCTRLIATRDVAKASVLGFVGGKWLDVERALVEGACESTHLYIERGVMENDISYGGEHPIVLSMKRHRNAFAYARDPMLDAPFDGETPRLDHTHYNARLSLCFDSQAKQPVLVVYATKDIKAECELLVFWPLGKWTSRDHRRLDALSRANHVQHRLAARLESRLKIDKPDPFQMIVPPVFEHVDIESRLSAESEWRYLCDSSDRDTALEASLNKRRPSSRRVDLLDALGGCTHAESIRVDDRSIRAHLASLPDHTPEWMDASVIGAVDPSLVEVRELTSIAWPARRYSTPEARVFGVFITRRVYADTIVCFYTGALDKHARWDSMYSYGVDKSAVPGLEFDLYVDALKQGGVARFINDNEHRNIQTERQVFGFRRTANVKPQVVVYEGKLYVAMCATREIVRDEEILWNYGPAYWQGCCAGLLHTHARFYTSIVRYNAALMSILMHHSPINPLIEAENEFECKSVPYPARSNDQDASDDEDEVPDGMYEVERIVNHRKRGKRVVYQIKWKGYDELDWHDEQGMHCPDLIEQYYAERRLKKMKHKN